MGSAQKCDELGYWPKAFIAMLTDHGAVDACTRVIMPKQLPPGFGRVFELGHLELSVEAIVVNGPWRILFDDNVIEKANKRLREYERPDLTRRLDQPLPLPAVAKR